MHESRQEEGEQGKALHKVQMRGSPHALTASVSMSSTQQPPAFLPSAPEPAAPFSVLGKGDMMGAELGCCKRGTSDLNHPQQ